MTNTLTRQEIADLIFTTCVGCENKKCLLYNIWPELGKALTQEEKEKFEKSVKQRLNIKAGKKQIEEAILLCPDCNPYDHDVTIGRSAPTPAR